MLQKFSMLLAFVFVIPSMLISHIIIVCAAMADVYFTEPMSLMIAVTTVVLGVGSVALYSSHYSVEK